MGRCITYIYFTTTFYQCNNRTERATISIANDYILVHWCHLCQHQSTITHYNVKCSEPYVFAPHCISNLLSLIHYMYLFRNMLIWTLKISGVYCWLNKKFHEVELYFELSWPYMLNLLLKARPQWSETDLACRKDIVSCSVILSWSYICNRLV